RKVTIEGRIYDLSHLDPFAFEFVVPEKVGRPPQIYAIDVQFSWHCFTRGIAAGENFPGTLAYSHGRETRLFDERRYRFSRQLPSIIRDIGSRKCFHTGKGNFFTVEFIDENGSAVEYAIFFKMSRRGKRGELLLMVESAYAQDNRVPRGRPHPPRPIRFSVIAYNTATGKPIKQPK
ncbi:MAG TPA: hypothetical protein VNF29_12385, partial [Candidatus Binataceae bacterium]|nr:hypothetical protein [Candidatus Binataceae bacterium]